MLAKGLGNERGEGYQEPQEALLGGGHVLYLDCGGDHMTVYLSHSLDCPLKMCSSCMSTALINKRASQQAEISHSLLYFHATDKSLT